MKLNPCKILLTTNNLSDKGGLALHIKNNIPVMAKPEQIFTRNGIETFFTDVNTPCA